ncbi:hypothetical protein B9G55_22290 [Saccharibacillus sp. O16]|nr:hypothetical protein B9G55_22290 [Saccharibacillus sp. O16]
MNKRKALMIVTLLYTGIILFFMLFAFDRMDSPSETYTFIWMPDNFLKLPDPSDLLDLDLMTLVSLGNTAAFIPFGLLIPMLYPMRFTRFILGFILAILCMETVQALTMLGSFDINDVLQNTSGAAIGYAAYSIGSRAKSFPRQITAAAASCAVLFLAIWGIGLGIDQAIQKRPAPFVAWNEAQSRDGQLLKALPPQMLQIGSQEITPRFNVYQVQGKSAETYRYVLDGKTAKFTLQYGIPDQEKFKGSISLSIDGKQVLSNSEEYQGHTPQIFKWDLEGAKELTITLEGSEKMWDIGSNEMKHFWE